MLTGEEDIHELRNGGNWKGARELEKGTVPDLKFGRLRGYVNWKRDGYVNLRGGGT